MALKVMDIYKNLPKTNCKDCGLPTCMAFAMQVAAKQKALADCPHVSDEAQSTLADASAPPMKLVKIGAEKGAVELGQETVMFRHEEKFHHPTCVAVRIADSLSDAEALEKVEQINSAGTFERIGEKIGVGLIALEVDGCDGPGERAQQVAEKSDVPLILVGKDVDKLKAAVQTIASHKPLVYRADAENIDALAAVAAEAKVPLAVGGGSLDEMAELTDKAKEKGVEEMILAFDGSEPGKTIEALTVARRAALKKHFRPLGYPSMVDASMDNAQLETVFASQFAAKYAGIVIINGHEPWELLPILTTIQNVYTDPQVPNTVEAKLYEIGNPTPDSPVLFTTNFSLTYFSVEAEVERSKIPAYVCVVETEGLGVLNAYAGDKISPEKVVKTLEAQKVGEKVNHHKLIIPGLLPIFRAEIEDTSPWKEVIIGPETASKIPAFLNEVWS